jgi:hypothetical protein
MSTTARIRFAGELILSTITNGSHMLTHATLTQATAVTASLLAGFRAGSGGSTPVSPAGMSAVREARSA